jgi:ammonium transporter, Amt family
MSAQTLDKISGLVGVNSLMAMVGGTLVALFLGERPRLRAQRPARRSRGRLRGLGSHASCRCAGHRRRCRRSVRRTVHPSCRTAGSIDDVLGVWPLHGLCGAWGGIAAGIFGSTALGGLGGVSFAAQAVGTGLGIGIAFSGGLLVYGVLKALLGLRLSTEEEFNGADLSIHKIAATADRDTWW